MSLGEIFMSPSSTLLSKEAVKQKVVIAMSGGVDSSVCASLMKKAGYECVGMTMRLWSGKEKNTAQSCCGAESLDDARLVADNLDIPYYAINFQKDFWEKVIKVFADEYFAGRTPSPCILCNEKLKFDTLYQKAIAIGATKVCTGHYARVLFNEKTKRWNLLKGKDLKKDQSYFLFSMTQDQLSKTLFPLGSYTKNHIRQLAAEDGLVTANKPESMDICFIPNGDYAAFLKKHFPDRLPEEGKIKHIDGTNLGKHQGIHSVTVGQRKGLGIAFGKPLYVTGIDAATKEVTVAEREHTYNTECLIKGMNWIMEEPNIGDTYHLLVKIRARSEAAPGTITVLTDKKARIVFDQPQYAIAPGQAAVIYDNDSVFAGGWIE